MKEKESMQESEVEDEAKKERRKGRDLPAMTVSTSANVSVAEEAP